MCFFEKISNFLNSSLKGLCNSLKTTKLNVQSCICIPIPMNVPMRVPIPLPKLSLLLYLCVYPILYLEVHLLKKCNGFRLNH